MNSSTERDPVCTYLEWDSEFFQHRIARLNRRRLDPATIAECAEFCRQHRIDCIYLLADSDDQETPRLAEANDFHFVDIRMTLEHAVVQKDLAAFSFDGTRFARESDLPALRAIARTAHRDTRFYFDGHFARQKCDLLYETWIENSFRGFAQSVLVAEADGEPAAYLTCHLNEQTSQIGLLGVAGSHRGKGLATKLVQAFLSWSHERGARRAVVVTQGRNVQAQRLYQHNGFLSSSIQLWYHRWFAP
jgi:dTDP-4-amino-4,6-dideoxy-D-galactose acyltransferase